MSTEDAGARYCRRGRPRIQSVAQAPEQTAAWSVAARQCPQPLVVDGVHQRVRMAMYELPVRF
jgi:hypothetical protein